MEIIHLCWQLLFLCVAVMFVIVATVGVVSDLGRLKTLQKRRDIDIMISDVEQFLEN